MEYNVNYNNRFKRDVTTIDSEEYKLFLNFLNAKILIKIRSLINNGNYKPSAYWNSILIYYKDYIPENYIESLGLKWKEAFDNGYDIKEEIEKKLNLIDVNKLEDGLNEPDIRTKTINRIVTNFTNHFINLDIPKLEEIVPVLIEENVLDIMSKFSPRWNDSSDKDVLYVTNFFNKKFPEIKELWLREASIKSNTYNLGLKEFVKNYVKKNILNEINTLANALIANITSETWSFKNNLNSYEIDRFGTNGLDINEVNDNLLKNFKLILKENFKIENNSDVEVSSINISKSAVREKSNGFKEIDVFLEGSIKLKLGDASITKNLRIKVPNVLFYNPKEEFQSLINDLVDEINDDKVFKVEQTNFLSNKVNNLEQLYDWFNTNGFNSLKLAKLESFRTQFPSFDLTDFKIEFINSPVSTPENRIDYRKIKLEFTFEDLIKNTDEKIFSKEIFVFSTKIIDLQKLVDFSSKNKPKYLFLDEWDSLEDQTGPEKIFRKNDEWIELLKKINPGGKWYKKYGNQPPDDNLLSYPRFVWTNKIAFNNPDDPANNPFFYFLIEFTFNNEINWKYASSNDKYAGWNPSLKKLKEPWEEIISYWYNDFSQRQYLEKWIEKKLEVNSSFVQENIENLQAPQINFDFTFEDIFLNLNELETDTQNLDLKYRKHFFRYANDDTLYVSFSFYNSKSRKLYTFYKPIFKKANTDEIYKVRDEIDEIHKKSLNQLSKIKLSDSNEEKKYLKKFQDLYNDSQTNYFQNEDFLNSFVNAIKLKQISEDYKADTKKIWIEILRLKHKEKVDEIKNLKGASEEEKQKLLKQLDEELIASLSKINDLNLDYEGIAKMLDSVDWNFKKVLNSKVIISKTFKYILASSAGVLALGSIASGASLISLIKSKKKLKKNNLKFKSRKGLILLTSLIGIASTIGSVGLSLFVFVSQGGF